MTPYPLLLSSFIARKRRALTRALFHVRTHGTRGCYVNDHCRCRRCKHANAEYMTRRNRLALSGGWRAIGTACGRPTSTTAAAASSAKLRKPVTCVSTEDDWFVTARSGLGSPDDARPSRPVDHRVREPRDLGQPEARATRRLAQSESGRTSTT